MSSDDGILINRRTLEAYYWQGDGVQPDDKPIATGKTVNEVIDNAQMWLDDRKLYTEYGFSFTDS